MRFARIIFSVAGIWGILILPPLYLMEQRIGRNSPPAITHPEYFYGFIGVALAFQIVFLIVGRDPVRYRPIMIPSMVEKFSFAIACSILFNAHRIPNQMFAASMIDLLFGILFVAAYIRTSSSSSVRRASAAT